MVCFNPIQSSVSGAVTKPLQPPIVAFSQTQPLQGGTNPATHYQARFFTNSSAGLTSGFVAEIWLAAGPGPIYTKVQRLVQAAGVLSAGTEICGTWDKTALLPTVNRVFSTSTDAYVFEHNNQFTDSFGQTSVTMSVDAANAVPVDGCCEETLAKLDQILSLVSKQYFTQP